jgi:hypothetical protein
MPVTSIANIQAKPSSRTTMSTPSPGSHGSRWLGTVPPATSGYSSARGTATASATAAAHSDSMLRALVGSSAAMALPTNGRHRSNRSDIDAQSMGGRQPTRI